MSFLTLFIIDHSFVSQFSKFLYKQTKNDLKKKTLTKTCGQENVWLGKCPFGEVSFGELPGRGIVRLRKCLSGKCPRRSVSRGTVQSGTCPHTGNFTLSLPLRYLLDLETIGSEKRRFLHIWLLQRIALYQKR